MTPGDGGTPVTIDTTNGTIFAGPGDVAGLAGLTVGDHIVVMTADVTGDPIVALAVLDVARPSTPTTNPTKPGSVEPGDAPKTEPPTTEPPTTEPPTLAPANEPVNAVIQSVDANAGVLVLQLSGGPSLRLSVNGATRMYTVSG